MPSAPGTAQPRLVIAVSSPEAGGIQRTASRLSEALIGRFDVHIVSVLAEPPPHFHRAPGVGYEDLGLLPPRSWRFASLRALLRLRRRLGVLRPDVVLCFGNRVSVLTLIATLGTSTSVIATERNDPRVQRVEAPVRWLRPTLYRRAATVVVQTQSVLEWAKDMPFANRTTVIPNAVEPTDHRARPAESRTVVALGRLVPQKGFDVLLRAFAQVADRYPDWSLEIGGEGPERQRLVALAMELGISDRVTFAGLIDGAQGWLAQGAIFVLPSRHEGFPNVLLEAMSVGLACIASRCPSGPTEIIDQGSDGLLFDVDDVSGLGQSLEELMADADLRQRLGSAAREAIERFDPKADVERWEATVIQALVEQRR